MIHAAQYRLTVKGNLSTAIKSAQSHGFAMIRAEYRPNPNGTGETNMLGVASEIGDGPEWLTRKLGEWFNEAGECAAGTGYPAGTLLHYSTVSEWVAV